LYRALDEAMTSLYWTAFEEEDEEGDDEFFLIMLMSL
jgi:hypothetical protein